MYMRRLSEPGADAAAPSVAVRYWRPAIIEERPTRFVTMPPNEVFKPLTTLSQTYDPVASLPARIHAGLNFRLAQHWASI